VLLVGDAAGLIDPVSGDGMYEAFVSARLAAETALELLDGRARSLDAYAARLRAALDPLTVVSWGVKRFAERWPHATVAAVGRPLVWRAVEGLVTGDLVGATRAAARPLDLLAPALW
jgi:flavin-dependent dehydrogenase